MTYRQTLDYLYNSLPVFQHIGGGAYKAGPDNILALEHHLGEPHRRFCSVHVAGTNGKGSVSHMTAAALTAAGYRTGLFTSPHLKDFRERIRIDGNMISEEEVVRFVDENREVIERIRPSFFEITTAIAFDHFARHGADIAVIETGMGGRLDSTNIIRPLVSVITNISWDHARFLGGTLAEIAGEKAGIIKENTPVVIGESDPRTQLVFIGRARELGSPILFADQTYRIVGQEHKADGQEFMVESLLDGLRFPLRCDLQGDYQRKNILTALAALDMLNGSGRIRIPREAVETGFARAASSTGLTGRWQILSRRPLTVCDTGHNEGGIAEVTAQIARQDFDRLYMVLGFVEDKDLSRVLPLLPQNARYIFTQAGISRALDARILQEKAAEYGLQGEAVGDVKQAVALARSRAKEDDMIYIGGSTFVVAEIL